jgi:HlyD family secretion protein
MIRRPVPPLPGILEANGRIEGNQAALGAKVGGKIVRLAVREGDALEAGALIAELASDHVVAQLAQAEHILYTAQEQLSEARSRVVAAQRQHEGVGLAVTLAERESRARVGQAEAALELAGASRVAVALRRKEVEIAADRSGEAQAAVQPILGGSVGRKPMALVGPVDPPR